MVLKARGLALIALVLICGPWSSPAFVDARKMSNSKSGKKKKKKSAGEAKKKKKSAGEAKQASFVKHANKSLQQERDRLCSLADKGDPDDGIHRACKRSHELILEGARFERLPDHFYANYLSMTVAYPLITEIDVSPLPRALSTIFFEAIRLHRALGYGNALRMGGYAQDVVEDAYWTYYELLEAEDGGALAIVPDEDATREYCSYINAEYEQLKNHARTAYDATDLPQGLGLFARDDIFLGACQSPAIGYVVRSDWEHHRKEVVGSLLTGCSRPIVLFTVFHWESLWYALNPATSGLSYDYLFESFDLILEHYQTGKLVC